MSMQGTYTRSLAAKLEAAGVTPAGKDWLMQALDPFSDVRHPTAGMPDERQGESLIQEITLTQTITAAGGYGPWDLHIALLDDLRDQTSNQIPMGPAITPAVLTDSGATTLASTYGLTADLGNMNGIYPFRAPINCAQVKAGSPTFPVAGTYDRTATGLNITGFNVNQFAHAQSRVIGMAVEAVNTTADLYKSGSVVCYTQPLCRDREAEIFSVTRINGSIVHQQLHGIRSRCPPQTVAQAMEIPGSTKWAAKDGAYQVMRFSKQDNPPADDVMLNHYWIQDPADPQVNGSGVVSSSAPTFGFGNVNDGIFSVQTVTGPPAEFIAIPAVPYCHTIPFDVSGIYFTGLLEQSSIEVTLRLFLEVFPTPAEPDLVVLAHPCAEYDPMALEIYSRTVLALPPAVPVDQNEDGGWWEKVMNTIATVAPMAGTALNAVLPGAGIAGTGVSALAKALSGIKLGKKAKKAVKASESSSGASQSAAPSPNAPSGGVKRRHKTKPKMGTRVLPSGKRIRVSEM